MDSYSGWYDMYAMWDMRSATVIKKLKKCFSTHGSPPKLVSGNARQFTSAEFREFCQEWDIIHVTSSPVYAQSNGLAERAVQSAKALLEKCKRDQSDVNLALFNMRNIPRDTVLGSAAQRLMSPSTRDPIPSASSLLKPRVISKKCAWKSDQSKTANEKSLQMICQEPKQTKSWTASEDPDWEGLWKNGCGEAPSRRSVVLCGDRRWQRLNEKSPPFTCCKWVSASICTTDTSWWWVPYTRTSTGGNSSSAKNSSETTSWSTTYRGSNTSHKDTYLSNHYQRWSDVKVQHQVCWL